MGRPRLLAGSLLVLTALLVAFPPQAAADGMTFRAQGGSSDVRATAQRAVLWLREGTWELHIQPRFDREQGSAAWVVPFSVQPEVHEGNADFFDHLELATAPVFVDECYASSGSFGCASDMAAGAGDLQSGQSSVQVWERGQVGSLDYVVLSADNGDELSAWLDQEGFDVPAEADELLADYQAEGAFFFVSRLSADADPEAPLAPVRFVLPELDEPSYPLRLTALGAPDGEVLDLTLWVIFPSSGPDYLPSSHPIVELDSYPMSPGEYRASLDQLFSCSPNGIALLYAERFADSFTMSQMVCSASCLSYADVGLSAPATWCPEFVEMDEAGVKLLRLEARLSANAMAADLALAADSYRQPYLSRVFGRWTGSCDDDDGCSASGPLRSRDRALLLSGALVVAIVLRRRRDRRRRS